MSQPEHDIDSLVRIIDPLASVRAHPEWFFRGGTFSAAEAVSRLLTEALAHGSTDVSVRQIEGYWVLASSRDWLDGDLQAFFSPTPDPRRGPNTSRVEVALTAFCPEVVTSASGSRQDIVASSAMPDSAATVLNDPSWGRVIAFLPPIRSPAFGEGDGGADGEAHWLRLTMESAPELESQLEDKIDQLPSKVVQLTGSA